jgi:capsular exopolysaccharide synthesis family protein
MTKPKGSATLLASYNKESPMGTEFRRLYSNLKSRFADARIQNIMVTSAMLGEGKSLTSSLLSVTIAELTKFKVALVDLDLRRPKIGYYFGLGNDGGVADVLTGKSSLKLVSRKTTIPNLTIIPSGKPDRRPSDVLELGAISSLFQELRFYFDYVIVDTPPVIPISDPLLIAEHMDGVILVVRGGVTQREVVSRAANLLLNSRVNLLGVVVNDYDEVLPYYYKERYYGYQYYRKGLKSD